ncbi:BTB/POZ domain-containing protein KCTD14 [Scleropages formosus]|uniref:BTB/POZ domain-containing protein KCTD14 n=1 Tax=Scleropages formosus TaxID=113540 RepID=UPI0010FA795B|nr:BTB/POZ domain-containing protein KCTD14 [Scleropages formosus]
MSLPDYRSPGKQSTPNFHTHSPVVQLNIGGQLFSTTLSTLRRCPDSKLADMFAGPPKLRADADGRFFLDRDGRHFGPILEFLRTGRLPTEHVREVYAEAVFYGIAPLVKQLEDSPQLFGETVARRQFLARVPNYAENLELIVRIARAEAMAARHSSVVVCVLRTEEDVSRYKDAVNSLDAAKESAVRFGPWKAAPTVSDLLDCIKMDIEAKGYRISFKPHSAEKGFSFKSYDFFYKIIFTWW